MAEVAGAAAASGPDPDPVLGPVGAPADGADAI
jgi:hypothetical protein